MSEISLLYVMAAFVIISAIALCIQAGMLAGIYKTTKQLQESINPLIPKVESLVAKADSTVEQIYVRSSTLATSPGSEWAQQNGQWVLGASGPFELLDAFKAYRLAPVAGQMV